MSSSISDPFHVPDHKGLGICLCHCNACRKERVGFVEFALDKKTRFGVEVEARKDPPVIKFWTNDMLLCELPLPKTKDDLFAAFAQMVAERLTE